MDKNDKEYRKWKLEQLIHKNKMKHKAELDEYFNDFVKQFGNGATILSEQKSDLITSQFVNKFPIAWYARIDWEQVKIKFIIEDKTSIMEILQNTFSAVNHSVYVFLCAGSNYPLIETTIDETINRIEKLLKTGGDKFIFATDFSYVLEIFHDDVITLGLRSE